MIQNEDGNFEASQMKVLSTAVDNLVTAYPWHGIKYHKDTLSMLESFPKEISTQSDNGTVTVTTAAGSKSKFTMLEYQHIVALSHSRVICV